jgi:hypothetical protein
MQIVMAENCPFNAGTIIEYGVMLISLLDTDKVFPTGKMT